MEIEINSTQNVTLAYRPAGVGLRLLSISLDLVFKYSYLLIVAYFFSSYLTYQRNPAYSNSNSYETPLAIMFIVLLPFFFYHLLCETFMQGQSLGKKLIKIKVVKLDGSQPDFGGYLLRWMLRLIDDGPVGLICIAVTGKSQRLGDMLAGTTVVELNNKVSLADTILQQQDPEHVVKYRQVSLLNDKDANVIKEVLEFSERSENDQHLKVLAEKIRVKYGITETHQNDREFLSTLLLDYSHYKFEN